MDKNIQYISNEALCTACGACAGVCPTHAIFMQWNAAGYLVAEISRDKCISCGLCLKACPSVNDNSIIPDKCDPFHGVCLNTYIGHATDPDIRRQAQSGGVVTSLLCYLLENHYIEGAIVNRFCEKTTRPEVICATNREMLLQCAGSYYCQSSVVKTILENQKKKLAAVVLGCQAESLYLLRKAMSNCSSPDYTIGLMCAGQYSGHYIDDLISSAGSDFNGIRRFRFRDKSAGGWPGNVKVSKYSGDIVLNKIHRLRLKPLYEAYRCLLCFDQLNVHSDITVGDPWGINRDDNRDGNTVIIVRTKKGQQIIEGAVGAGYLQCSKICLQDVLRGQKIDTRLKTQFYAAIRHCRDTNSIMPYKDGWLPGNLLVTANRRLNAKIIERMDYSRKVYMEDEPDKIVAIRRKKRWRLLKRRILAKSLKFARYPLSYFRRSTK